MRSFQPILRNPNPHFKPVLNCEAYQQQQIVYEPTKVMKQSMSTNLSHSNTPDSQIGDSKTMRLTPTERSDYENSLMDAIEQIDRLNSLLTSKLSQMAVLNANCKVLKEQISFLKNSCRDYSYLKVENSTLKQELEEKKRVISSLAEKSEGKMSRALSTFYKSNINQCDPEEGTVPESQYKRVCQQLAEEKRKNEQKNVQISSLMQKIAGIEDHLNYISKYQQLGIKIIEEEDEEGSLSDLVPGEPSTGKKSDSLELSSQKSDSVKLVDSSFKENFIFEQNKKISSLVNHIDKLEKQLENVTLNYNSLIKQTSKQIPVQ